MKTLIIDGREELSRAELHEKIASALDFPEYYGKNLDALYDCLTDMADETEIEIVDFEAFSECHGKYANRLVRVILEACEGKEKLHIKFKDGR